MKISCIDVISAIKYVIAFFVSIFMKNRQNKKYWLFAERHNEARDNSYHLFKYVYTNCQEQIEAYYAIDFSCSDYNRLEKYSDRLIKFGSFKHYLYYFLSGYLLSTHIYGYAPNRRVFQKLDRLFAQKKKRVFLQHGVIMNFHPADMYEFNNISLYICSAEREKEFLMTANHFPEKVMCLSGLARYDNLGTMPIKRQILFMPTWRGYLSNMSAGEFIKSEYFNKIESFLNDEMLINFLRENNIKLVFYPHYEMQKFIGLFSTCEKEIVIAPHEEYDVQELLNASALLITDYSSIHFDFAYQKKPLCYYQFDEKDFYGEHYTKGYYDFETDGFGPVFVDATEVINYLKERFCGEVVMQELYVRRVEAFFRYKDRKNCERIVTHVLSMGEIDL